MSEQKHLPTLSLFSLLFCAIQKLIFTFFSFYGFCESVVVTFQQTVCVHPDCPAVCQIYNNDTRSLPCVKCYGSNTSFATVNSWQTDRQTASVHVAVPLANNGVSRMINVSVIPATPFKKKNNKKNNFSPHEMMFSAMMLMFGRSELVSVALNAAPRRAASLWLCIFVSVWETRYRAS